MTNYGLVKIDYRTAPGVTASVLSSGVILGYLAPSASSTYAYPMPWIYHGSNPNLYVSFVPIVGRMIFFNKEINSAGGGIVPNAAYVYRYVIIPGGVLGGRLNEKAAEINGSVYTESQLKAMSYHQICSLLNIPQ
jgi:hypothetical protein